MQTSDHERPRKRILIEASKLADEKMDGIKRYVVELLRAVSRMDLDDFDLDVMILDKVYPLKECPADYLPVEQSLPASKQDNMWLRRIGSLVPPILVRPVKYLIPAWAARRFLGKEKADISLPALDLRFRKIPFLVLPPVLITLFQMLAPAQFVQLLCSWGMLDPPPRDVDPKPYDLIHHTLPNNLHNIRKTSTPMLVTVHDLSHIACPEYQTHSNSFTLKNGLERAVADGAHFLTVSGATQAGLIDEYSLDPGRVRTAYNGCSAEHFRPVRDPEARAQVCRKYCIPESPFLLALSTIEPRKNLAGTIEAFNQLVKQPAVPDVHLVIAGAMGWKSRGVMRAAEASGRIHLAGYIADEDLATLYSSARGFVYVSHYEGFGLPLLEAMRCGLPVIYGNNSSMPEIVADAGLAADSRDVHDITRQMRRLVCDDELVNTLGHKALKRAHDFSWERTAAQTLAAYTELSLPIEKQGRSA